MLGAFINALTSFTLTFISLLLQDIFLYHTLVFPPQLQESFRRRKPNTQISLLTKFLSKNQEIGHVAIIRVVIIQNLLDRFCSYFSSVWRLITKTTSK